MTRVSIITPFLNAGPFIEESIKSVLSQTYDDWELLLVDDGSTDASTEIALKYAATHPHKLRYLSHEHRQNRGASASRNLAARHARGEYLAFLDADDVYLPRKLEVKVPILDANPEVAML
jgi:glycosyltransferase involved in cell wall biosynthesis